MSEFAVTRKSIVESQAKGYGELLTQNIKANWCFNKTYEKIIFFIILFLGVWKLLNLFGLFL